MTLSAGKRPGVLALAALFALGACTLRTPPPSGGGSGTGDVRFHPMSVASLPGWHEDSLHEALPALERSCGRLMTLPRTTPVGPKDLGGTVADWVPVCSEAGRLIRNRASAEETRRFITKNFKAWKIVPAGGPDGLFTGYYEAMLDASKTRSSLYATPVHGLPAGWDRTGTGRPDRKAIEAGALEGVAPVLLWARDPVDLFLLQIQGSGIVRLPDGSRVRIGYAGDNGKTFVGIGRLMKDRGYGDGASMPAIRAWLKANPDKAGDLMSENPRYIFFRLIEGDGPIGAQGVPLTAGRSLAVDRDVVPLGALMWISTKDSHGTPVRRLALAQDTGSAIKGPVRVDVFWGSGEEALYYAGGMKSQGQAWVLLPERKS